MGRKIFISFSGIAYFFNFQYGKAAGAFSEFLKNNPDNLGVRNDLVYSLLESKRVDEAHNHLEFLLGQDSGNIEGLVSMGKCHQMMGRDDAISYYEKAVGIGVRQKVTYGWSNKILFGECDEREKLNEERENQLCEKDAEIDAITSAYGELINHHSVRGDRLKANCYKVSYVAFKAKVIFQKALDFLRVF